MKDCKSLLPTVNWSNSFLQSFMFMDMSPSDLTIISWAVLCRFLCLFLTFLPFSHKICGFLLIGYLSWLIIVSFKRYPEENSCLGVCVCVCAIFFHLVCCTRQLPYFTPSPSLWLTAPLLREAAWIPRKCDLFKWSSWFLLWGRRRVPTRKRSRTGWGSRV